MYRAVALTVVTLSLVLPPSSGCSSGAGEAAEAAPPQHEAHGQSQTDSEAAPVQPEGHMRMLALLREIHETSEVENPFTGQGQASQLRADLAAQPPEEIIPKRWYLRLILAAQELRLGNQERAVELYEEAYALLKQSKDPVPREHYVRNMFEMGVAYLRMAETRNCVKRHTSDSCLLPIEEGGVHVDQEPSAKAAGYLLEAADQAPRGSKEAIRARWLLNIAHMTLGTWPAGVPERHRIGPEAFASDEPFPRFYDVAGKLGLNVFNHAGGAIADDFDLDGDLDLLTTSSFTEGQTRYWRNQGDGTFQERTVQAGLQGLYGGLYTTQADYDGDGDADVLVLRGAWWRKLGRHPKSLLRNNGDGTFTDVTFEAGLGAVHYPTQAGDWADYDLDGDLDLFVGNESGKAVRFDDLGDADERAPSQLFRNRGDGTFEDVASAAGLENLRYAKGVSWGDYDNDRYPDLFVSNGGHYDRLYRNKGDGTFVDVAPDLGVTEPIASFATWFWDVNNDGWLDIWVSAYGGPQIQPDVASVAAGFLGLPDEGGELPKLYLNDGKGGFRDVAVEWGLGRATIPMGSSFGDLDNDGFPDFYLGTGYPFYEGLIPNVLYHNLRGKGFADVTTAAHMGHLQKGHAVVFADLDNDGDQDVFEQVGGAWRGDAYTNALFENPGFGNHWLKVSLKGVRSNRQGVGARMRLHIVEDGTPRTVHHLVGTGGSFGSSPLRQEIGVGQAERIAALEVYWPASDTTQRFEDVAADQWIEIVEGQTDYRALPVKPMQFSGTAQGHTHH